MQLTLWLILSFLMVESVCSADERSLEELINLVSKTPKKRIDPQDTLLVLDHLREDLFEDGKDEKKYSHPFEGKIILDLLIQLAYSVAPPGVISEYQFNEELEKWLLHPNVAEYIYYYLSRRLYSGPIPRFITLYQDSTEVSSKSEEEFWSKLNDDSDMSPNELRALLVPLRRNLYIHNDRDIINKLMSWASSYDLKCNRDNEPPNLEGAKRLDPKSFKIVRYIEHVLKQNQEDCNFKSMFLEEKLHLPIPDIIDCDFILDQNRIRLSYKELFDISRALVQDPSKCPDLKGREGTFKALLHATTCAGSDCCKPLGTAYVRKDDYMDYNPNTCIDIDFHQFMWKINEDRHDKECAQYIADELRKYQPELLKMAKELLIKPEITKEEIRGQVDYGYSLKSEKRLVHASRSLDKVRMKHPCNEIVQQLKPVLGRDLSDIKKQLLQDYSKDFSPLLGAWNWCATYDKLIDEVKWSIANGRKYEEKNKKPYFFCQNLS